MNTYKFLLKPIFFIFNLIFATWLVLKIEHLKPSDFGKNGSLFKPNEPKRIVTIKDRSYLISLATDFAEGKIDSLLLGQKIDAYLQVPAE